MDHLDDWFNVVDDDFEAKMQENKEPTTLFADSVLVVFWKFLSWCKKKRSFNLSAFIFFLVTLFCIEIHNTTEKILFGTGKGCETSRRLWSAKANKTAGFMEMFSI
jgi:hypothetical protein